MTVSEAEWDDPNRRAALALLAYRDGLCPLCGRPVDVCQAEANEDAFEADLPSRCAATTVRLKAMARHRESGSVDEDTEAALLWGARLKG